MAGERWCSVYAFHRWSGFGRNRRRGKSIRRSHTNKREGKKRNPPWSGVEITQTSQKLLFRSGYWVDAEHSRSPLSTNQPHRQTHTPFKLKWSGRVCLSFFFLLLPPFIVLVFISIPIAKGWIDHAGMNAGSSTLPPHIFLNGRCRVRPGQKQNKTNNRHWPKRATPCREIVSHSPKDGDLSAMMTSEPLAGSKLIQMVFARVPFSQQEPAQYI